MAFPKTQSASCLLTSAPSSVSDQQMKDLHIRARARAASGDAGKKET